MSTHPRPATSPSTVRPDEAQVRTEDFETPPPDTDERADEANDPEAKPGEGENAPGFLKPRKP